MKRSNLLVNLGKAYYFLAYGTRAGQSISALMKDLILVPSGSFTSSGSPFELIFLIFSLIIRQFPVAHESKIA